MLEKSKSKSKLGPNVVPCTKKYAYHKEEPLTYRCADFLYNKGI